jgi:DNA-binding PadR family transcriptional regulator
MESPLSARAALLQALTHPGHGTELIRRIASRTRGRVRLHQGSVYRALRDLERRGLVRMRTVRSGRAGRPRRYYELTPGGVAVAEAERNALADLVAERPGPTPSPVERDLMRERIKRCAELSALVLDLRRRVREADRA